MREKKVGFMNIYCDQLCSLTQKPKKYMKAHCKIPSMVFFTKLSFFMLEKGEEEWWWWWEQNFYIISGKLWMREKLWTKEEFCLNIKKKLIALFSSSHSS